MNTVIKLQERIAEIVLGPVQEVEKMITADHDRGQEIGIDMNGVEVDRVIVITLLRSTIGVNNFFDSYTSLFFYRII